MQMATCGIYIAAVSSEYFHWLFFKIYIGLSSLLIHTITKIDCCTQCQKQQLTKTAAHSLTDM